MYTVGLVKYTTPYESLKKQKDFFNGRPYRIIPVVKSPEDISRELTKEITRYATIGSELEFFTLEDRNHPFGNFFRSRNYCYIPEDSFFKNAGNKKLTKFIQEKRDELKKLFQN